MPEFQERLQAAVGETYRIDRELGGGGMSRVFVAQETALSRSVVIKVLPPDMAAGVNQERFHREIQLAASLQHPHVVPLLTAGAHEDLLYYVMPYIEGESLRAKLAREGELPVGESVRILREVVDALAYAHRNDVVHRDIKPDNVLLSEGHAVVTDFGVAKAVAASGSSSLTSLGVALGTPAYMAPEQAAADPHTDHRADIYAVGALAYEMLTGRPPFTGASAQAVMAAHVTDVPEPVTRHRATVSEALNALVMRCLEKKAADRWQSAAGLLPQLEAMTTPSGGVTPTGSAPVAAVSAETMLRRSHPARVLGLFAVMSVAVLGIVYFLMVQLGLPDWVLPGAIAVLIAGLPIVVFTGHLERRRAVAKTTGIVLPAAQRGIHGWLNWRRAIVGGAIAFAALGLAVTVYMAMRLLGIGPVGTLVATGVLEERERLVLAEFENRTADSTLGETITELFRIDLSQSPTVTIMEPGQVARVLARMERAPNTPLTFELASEVAEREALKAVLGGEIRPVGDGYVLSSRLVSVSTGDVLAASRETAADANEIVGAIDRLSAKLRERIGESLRTIRVNEPLERVTTRSMEALRKYAQAVRVFNQGNYARAITLLEETVAEDTGFAMAYRKLGVALANGGEDRDRIVDALTKAFERRDRVTERERYLTEGTYYASVEDDDQATTAAYESLLDKYPSDGTALNNLALRYSSLGRWADAEELYRRTIEYGTAGAIAYGNLAAPQVAQGKFAAAESTVALFAENFPQHPGVEGLRADLASSRGDYAKAEQHILTLREAQRGNLQWQTNTGFQLTSLAAVRGKVAEAEDHVRGAFSVLEERGLLAGPMGLTEAFIQSGIAQWFRDDSKGAVRTLETALRRYPLTTIPPDDRPYFDLAQTYASAGQPERARRWLAEWEKEVDEETRARREVGLYFARGQIALAEDRPLEAVAEFRKAEAEMTGCPICALFELGEAYDRAGQTDSTLAIYERYVSTPRLYRMSDDALQLPIIYRRLGELYEGRGDTERAADYYNRFVDLWQDADAELQSQVDEIRERLTRLVAR